MHNLTTPIELRRPALVHYGSGTLSKLADLVAEGGYKAPFVVADPINAARLDALGLGTVACFGDVVPEPGSDNLDKAVAAATGADLVIGFGGGSGQVSGGELPVLSLLLTIGPHTLYTFTFSTFISSQLCPSPSPGDREQ